MNFTAQEILTESVRLFNYNSITGEFIRIAPRTNGKVGMVAGYQNKNGYRAIRIFCKAFYEHRIAFLLMTGAWPTADVDHIDGDRTNNRWANLRAATRSQNAANSKRHKDNRSIAKGVRQTRGGRWEARIFVRGKPTTLGCFDTVFEASEAYNAAAKAAHGEFARLETLQQTSVGC